MSEVGLPGQKGEKGDMVREISMILIDALICSWDLSKRQHAGVK